MRRLIVLGIVGLIELVRARRADDALLAAAAKSVGHEPGAETPRPSLTDLAILAFVASLAFMALEMVAGRLVQRHLGSSIYGWTSVIGVLAGRPLVRQLPGGKDRRLRQEREAGELAVPGGVDPDS